MNLLLLIGTYFTLLAQPTTRQSLKSKNDPNAIQKEVFDLNINENDTALYKNHYLFEKAFYILQNMLTGQEPLNFKKAIFYVENAFYDGKLSWKEYDDEVQRIKALLNKIIVLRNLQAHKTAGNFAIFTYMTDSIPENKFCSYKYDYTTFVKDGGEEAGMVTRLLKTKLGNCRSLPYLYKILAEEINVEASLAIVPMHIYIKHRDEKGNWWNLELTSGTFSRSSFIMESFNVSEQAIKSGLFMKALTDKETVALCLLDLLNIYESKTGIYSNKFVCRCYSLGLKYYPVSQLQNFKFGDIKYQLDKEMAKSGLNNYWHIKSFPQLVSMFQQMDSTSKFITKTGYTSITTEQYREKATMILNHKTKLSN